MNWSADAQKFKVRLRLNEKARRRGGYGQDGVLRNFDWCELRTIGYLGNASRTFVEEDVGESG